MSAARSASIAKSYDKRAVLHDVSLSVARGEVVGLLGPTRRQDDLLLLGHGPREADAGRIFLDGSNITKLPMYRRAILGLGYLLRKPRLPWPDGRTEFMAVLEISEPNRAECEAG